MSISVSGVTKLYGKQKALDNISFEGMFYRRDISDKAFKQA